MGERKEEVTAFRVQGSGFRVQGLINVQILLKHNFQSFLSVKL
jgi:hypothetical protein